MRPTGVSPVVAGFLHDGQARRPPATQPRRPCSAPPFRLSPFHFPLFSRSGTTVDLKPGHDVYLKIDIVEGFWKGGGKMTQVAPQQGTYEATRLDLIETKEIEDTRFR